jgi:hypothetical protein
MTNRILIAVLGGLLIFFAGCGVTDPDVDADGVVRFFDIEGGCWVIDTGDQRLEPINLQTEFQVDGLAVNFEATPRMDLASICMMGTIVELQSIELAG